MEAAKSILENSKSELAMIVLLKRLVKLNHCLSHRLRLSNMKRSKMQEQIMAAMRRVVSKFAEKSGFENNHKLIVSRHKWWRMLGSGVATRLCGGICSSTSRAIHSDMSRSRSLRIKSRGRSCMHGRGTVLPGSGRCVMERREQVGRTGTL